jgi:hypothetical protein
MSEKTASDAPVWYSAEAASAWADGFNAATEQRCSADSASLRDALDNSQSLLVMIDLSDRIAHRGSKKTCAIC